MTMKHGESSAESAGLPRLVTADINDYQPWLLKAVKKALTDMMDLRFDFGDARTVLAAIDAAIAEKHVPAGDCYCDIMTGQHCKNGCEMDAARALTGDVAQETVMRAALREIANMSHNCRSVDIAKAALAAQPPAAPVIVEDDGSYEPIPPARSSAGNGDALLAAIKTVEDQILRDFYASKRDIMPSDVTTGLNRLRDLLRAPNEPQAAPETDAALRQLLDLPRDIDDRVIHGEIKDGETVYLKANGAEFRRLKALVASPLTRPDRDMPTDLSDGLPHLNRNE
jgi:hypothetical protein